jgi:hypothetical protein
MSADPFANTTTVKNILQHIISPKIVSDGNGGYVTKTDLVNVDNLLFTSASIIESENSSDSPVTSQCGIVTATQRSTFVYHSRVTPNSIIFAVPRENRNIYVVNVVTGQGVFIINLNSAPFPNMSVGWFIASF